jgi:hypothetical protein
MFYFTTVILFYVNVHQQSSGQIIQLFPAAGEIHAPVLKHYDIPSWNLKTALLHVSTAANSTLFAFHPRFFFSRIPQST